GTVLRSHAGGYLVFEPHSMASLQCQARKRLKKERVSILTGDRVELVDVDLEQGTATITGCRDRWSILSRPPLANVDQVVIVQAVRQPEWNQLWCDRYIVHFQLELPDTKPILCFNKCDLIEVNRSETLRGIYESLGYDVVLMSAKTGMGFEQLYSLLAGKITVFAGPSGVGKSSILNKLDPGLNLKIGVMDHDYGVGRQTTTYSKLYPVLSSRYPDMPTWVADTPGFNLQEIKYPMPMDVMWQFPEIAGLSNECKFSNCLHLVEQDCKVIESVVEDDAMPQHLDGDAAPSSVSINRYNNYVSIVAEAQEVDNYRRTISTKVEAAVKTVGGKGGKTIPRLSNAYRTASRRREKQKLNSGVVFDDEMDESQSDSGSQD
ncbi:MAG: ribosome small subunit-dependent GTPase A, partial [Candidatus Obscuribacterales bacterium]|nr:ribosome small subunit-dependent GTPase A [Candidatus Obscuribacterales bacterium]